ncbi:MAG: N-carbamoyl-D-amino-acid hydrolase, partial [Alphaproteobacteria bacterium]|nr:N-carbamoyl-D-amino-acid hydrolase [Alphaproteobacteria bacterium]
WHGGTFGMAICNDRRWPETYRVMGLQGAEMIMLGFNTPDTNMHFDEPLHLRMFHHRLSCQAGAYQNACWVVATAKAGREDGFKLFGGSLIVAPTGEIAAEAMTEGDELITAPTDLDFGDNLKRNVFNFAAHRRIEHYKLITERTGAEKPAEAAGDD